MISEIKMRLIAIYTVSIREPPTGKLDGRLGVPILLLLIVESKKLKSNEGLEFIWLGLLLSSKERSSKGLDI